MKRLILIPLLVLSLGCRTGAFLTLAQVETILTDAAAGVSVGCGTGWLEPPLCDDARRVLDEGMQAAQAAAAGGWQAATKSVLVNEENRLPADSKIRPYLDAVISLL